MSENALQDLSLILQYQIILKSQSCYNHFCEKKNTMLASQFRLFFVSIFRAIFSEGEMMGYSNIEFLRNQSIANLEFLSSLQMPPRHPLFHKKLH